MRSTTAKVDVKTVIDKRRAEVEAALLKCGYTHDRWGHLVRTVNGDERTYSRVMRVKLLELCVRIEIQGTKRDEHGRLPWLLMTRAYYTKIINCGDGRLRIGSMFISGHFVSSV